MRWLDRLARQPAEVPVSERLATALEAAKRNDYATALGIWEPLAQAGVARAQNNIAACFVEGLGVSVILICLPLAALRRPATGSTKEFGVAPFPGEGVAQTTSARPALPGGGGTGNGPAQTC